MTTEESDALQAEIQASILRGEGGTIRPLTPVSDSQLQAWILLAQARDHAAGWRTADQIDPLVAALREAVVEIYRLRGLLHGGLRTPTDADPPGTLLGYVAFVKGERQKPLPHRGWADDDESE